MPIERIATELPRYPWDIKIIIEKVSRDEAKDNQFYQTRNHQNQELINI